MAELYKTFWIAYFILKKIVMLLFCTNCYLQIICLHIYMVNLNKNETISSKVFLWGFIALGGLGTLNIVSFEVQTYFSWENENAYHVIWHSRYNTLECVKEHLTHHSHVKLNSPAIHTSFTLHSFLRDSHSSFLQLLQTFGFGKNFYIWKLLSRFQSSLFCYPTILHGIK